MTTISAVPSDMACEVFPGLVGARPSASPAVAPPRHILHVINGEHYSGAERVQDLLAEQLPACGFEVTLACIKPGKFPQARRYQQAPLHQVPMRSKIDLRVVMRLAGIVRSAHSVLIHAHTPRSALVARMASILTRVPMVYHVHSPVKRDTTHAWRNRVNQWTEAISLAGSPTLITVSESLRQHMLAAGYPAARTHCVPNGVPAPAISRDDRPPTTPWVLGTVALFRPRKGLEVLLDAVAQLARADLPVRLLAVGAFETREYEQQIQQHVVARNLQDRIEWTGFTTDVAKQLTRMDLLALPSLFGEGLPMVVLEAMAAGVPVVASRVEGVPEAIEDGVSGCIVEPGSASDLADGIARVVRGEINWTQLRRRALARHGECFSDRIMASRTADIYRHVLAGRAPL
ncbi:MAG: glycosyltransferase [Pirellulaceae bacterium]